MSVKPTTPEGRFRAGIEDAIILPLVVAASTAKHLAGAVLSLLVRILDYAFVLAINLTRFPLFVVKALGDGVIAAVQGFVSCLPVSEENRRNWHELIGRKWARIRQAISYKAFEEAVHRAFERGMGWVFGKCRNLAPRTALYVIAGAVLWLPISFGSATAVHTLLLANAAVLPPWMQLLHPFATLIAKSKLLVLPVYPAAWPQAKKHPFIQMIAKGYRDFESLFLIQKMEHRYRQTEHAFDRTARTMESMAAVVGLYEAAGRLKNGFTGIARRSAKAFRATTTGALRHFSQAWLIGPVVRRFLSELERVEQQHEKASEKLRGAFARWSIKFSAEYYEAKAKEKEREKAAKAASAKLLEGSGRA
jgi:hypothetical protein